MEYFRDDPPGAIDFEPSEVVGEVISQDHTLDPGQGHGRAGDIDRKNFVLPLLLTLCERKTRLTLTAPLKTKSATETGTALGGILGRLPTIAHQILTLDNGSEFAGHNKLEANLGIIAYFCDPHSPWQRGNIENTNGLL